MRRWATRTPPVRGWITDQSEDPLQGQNQAPCPCRAVISLVVLPPSVHLIWSQTSGSLHRPPLVISSSSHSRPLPSPCLSRLVNGLITSLLLSASTSLTFLTPHRPAHHTLVLSPFISSPAGAAPAAVFAHSSLASPPQAKLCCYSSSKWPPRSTKRSNTLHLYSIIPFYV